MKILLNKFNRSHLEMLELEHMILINLNLSELFH